MQVTQAETGFTFTAHSNADGNYVAPSLLPGTYAVTVEKQGFQAKTIRPVEVNVDATVQLNVQLVLEGVQQQVSVEASAPQIEADTSAIGQVVRTQAIVDLPLNGRNFVQLALLSAGAVPLPTGNSDAAANNETSLNISGGRESSNQFTIDGTYNNSAFWEGLNIQLSIDAIREFKVQRNTFSAEFGQGTSIINVATLSGTNRLHGTAYEFLRNNVLDARQFFDASTPPFRQNQYGASLGGPIIHNRTFFFLNFESLRLRRSNTLVGTLPTAQQLSGNFGSTTIKDPRTGAPFVNNIIPSDRISPLSERIIAYYPQLATGGPLNDRTTARTTNDTDQFTVRLDHRFSDKDLFFGRYTWAQTALYTPGLIKLTGATLADEPQNGVLQYSHIFTPTLLNEVRFGINRNLQQKLQEGANGQNILQFQNIFSDPVNYGLPVILMAGYSTVGGSTGYPDISGATTFQYDDSLTWIHGNHTLKFGIDLRIMQLPHLPCQMCRGQYAFTGSATGNSVADFLLGVPTVAIGAGKAPTAYMSLHEMNWFVQDDWKVSPTFTLNLGLRYERTGVITDRFRGRLGVFDEATGKVVTGSNVDSSGLVNPDNNDFGPRVGFAWQPFHGNRTVIRSAYGLYYDVKPINEINFSLGTELQFRAIPVAPTSSWDSLFPAAGSGIGVGILTDDPFARTPYVHMYSFGIQHQLTNSLLIEASYIGSEGRKLNRRIDLNQGTLPQASGQPLAQRVPYPALGSIVMAKDIADSNYNAFELRAEERLSHNLSFLAVYTFSKSFDTSSFSGDSSSGAAGIPQNRLNEKGEYGLSAFDQRHRFVMSYVYALPFGAGQRFLTRASGVSGFIVSGWQINGITTLASGNPFTAQVLGGDRSQTGTFGGGVQRANVVAGQNPNLPNPSVQEWFNTAAFTVAPLGTFGNEGRNNLIAPGTVNFDFSAFKTTRITESVRVELRAEMFNIFNHPQFLSPVSDPTNQAFGQITAARPAREIQFGLKLKF